MQIFEEEFWTRTRSVTSALSLPAAARRLGKDVRWTDGAGLAKAWEAAAPGDFVAVRKDVGALSEMADAMHLDVLEMFDGRSAVARKPRGSGKAVYTLMVGEAMRRSLMARAAMATMRAYSDRIGADLRVVRKTDPGTHMWFGKWKAFELLKEYDRVMYLDGDVMVMPDCPDAFEMVPEGRVGGYVEGWYRKGWVQDEWRTISGVLGEKVRAEDFLDEYVNAGMFVASRAHAGLFDPKDAELVKEVDSKLMASKSRLHDQSIFNWRRLELGFGLCRMPAEMNFLLWPFSAANRFSAYVLHYAGEGKKFMAHDVPTVMDAHVNGRRFEAGVAESSLRWMR